MSERFPNLFSPITVRGKTFKNRILVSPMGLGEFDGQPGAMSEGGLNFYRAVAAGGSARICTGENDVVYGSAVMGKYDLFLDEVPGATEDSLRAYADMCHEYGALAFTSFDHMGLYCRSAEVYAKRPPMLQPRPQKHADGTPYVLPDKIYGPSEMDICEPYDGVTSRRLEMDNADGVHVYEMSEAQMNDIADAFALCARNAKRCGLDGMVIHSGHGFLFSQWISRRFNKRADLYGGSMENRARFPIMCLKRIREAVGDDFLVEMRFSAEENDGPITDHAFLADVIDVDETVAFFKELDKYPGLLDIAHITGGLHTVPVYNTRVTANSLFPMAVNLRGAAAVKAAVKNIKVGVVGSLSDPELCERVIADGQADFVIMCRQLLMSDPEFPNKARDGHPEQINNCLRCVLCHANGHCAVNPGNLMAGEQDPLLLRPAKTLKHVAVIGGGIAGLKAAEYAAQAGHTVDLYEQDSAFGGILRYTDRDEFKTDIRRFKNAMTARLEGMPNVTLHLNTRVEPRDAAAIEADAVIVAIGGENMPLPVPVEENAPVLDPVTAYLHPERVGHRVVIIGGGLTGCEAAIHWGSLNRDVTLVSRSKELMRHLQPRMPADGSPDTHLIWLNKLAVSIRAGYACTAVAGDGVYARSEAGELFIPADTVINASGVRANKEAAHAFEGTAPSVRIIGDCVGAGLIGDAVLAAKQAVIALSD